MPLKIKVLIVDDIDETRESIRKLIDFHPDITIIDEAGSAEEAIEKAKKLQPDIVLMDVNMPGMDGISATNILSDEVPGTCIIIMSVQGEQEYLRRAMIAGAKDYLVKPFTRSELLQTIKEAFANEQKRRKLHSYEAAVTDTGKIITVFSTKGGVGKTTIATNLAVALAAKTGARVGILDADLQFGDVALFLNVLPRTTIVDLVSDIDHLDEKLLQNYLTPFNDNVQLLAAPLRPEQSELISPGHLSAILKMMRTMFKYVVVDTVPTFNEDMLAILDISDLVLVVTALDLSTIKNVKLCLEIMESLNYPKQKLHLLLNRANTEGGMDVKEAAESLGSTFVATLPSDGKVAISAVNRGIPFVISNPDAPISQSIFNLTKIIASGNWEETEKEPPKSVVGKLRRFFK